MAIPWALVAFVLLLLLVVVPLVVGAVTYSLARSRYRPSGEPQCGKCGYGVRGVGSLNCPECGADLREVGISTGTTRPERQRALALAVVAAAIAIVGPTVVIIVIRLLA